jgi:glucose-1-phosphate thymidylyltransferase
MQVIIPLAGFGSRLRPHTYTKPKPMINVAGKPVLGHILDKLSAANVRDVSFVTGYLGDKIQEYVEQNYPRITGRYVEQKVLDGQASAILLAKHFVSGPTFIVFVDTLADADLSVLKNTDADGVIYVKEVDDPRRFGVVKLDEHGYIQRFVEKPSAMDNKLVVIGMYYVKDAQLLMRCCEDLVQRKIQTKGEFFLADAFNLMIERGAKLRTQRVDVWLDAGKPDAVLETNRYLLAHGHDNSAHWAQADCIVVPPVNIHTSAKIRASVIGPNTTIAENCEITNSVIRESIVDSGAEVTDHVLAHSLIGRDAILSGRPRKFNIGDSSVVGFDEE